MPKIPLAKTLPRYILTLPAKVYTDSELSRVISDYSKAINTPLDGDATAYIDYLVNQKAIEAIALTTPKGKIKRYALHNPSPLQLGMSLKSDAYFSHLTAAYLLGLIDKESLHFYVSSEAPMSSPSGGDLEQDTINAAFQNKQRTTQTILEWKNYKFHLLTSLDTGRMGIEKRGEVFCTTIERTLLDITVRPTYGGGTATILAAYQKAMSLLSVKRLIKMMDTMQFIYPYHQSIGFYLTRAGYTGPELKQLARRPRPFRFYTDYAIKNPRFADDWNIYFPNDLVV